MKQIAYIFFLSAAMVKADGHGPAFGFSTALLGRGDSSIETALTWRAGVAMIGPRFSYGISPQLQFSVSAPFHLNHGDHPVGRISGGMPGNPEAEALLAWRFQHALTGVGTRHESTLYVGMSGTTQRLPRADGRALERQPGYYVAAATGHISRRYYVWAGAGYQRYGRWTGGASDHQSDTFLSSVVVGWRPPFFDRDYPKPDIRFFWETTGEYVGRARLNTSALSTGDDEHSHGDTPPPLPTPEGGIQTLPNSGGRRVFSGPTFLCTFKGFALQTGILFNAWNRLNGTQPNERVRVMAGVTYYFLKGRK